MTRTSSDDNDSALDRERALSPKQASPIIGAAPVTLATWRTMGVGPKWFRCGRHIRYRLGDLLDWRDAQTVGKRGRR